MSVQPIPERDIGDRFVSILDPFGHRCVEDITPDQRECRMAEWAEGNV
jgi:hypothetical protein